MNNRLDIVNKQNTSKKIIEVEDFIAISELNMNNHFGTFIKNIVKCIEVNSSQQIKILYL